MIAATDGSCRGNPGPGGWAYVIENGTQAWGQARRTTNNAMELTAVLELLKETDSDDIEPEPLTIQTDSQLVVNTFTGWAEGWKRRGWLKADKTPPANLAIVKEIYKLLLRRKVTFEWVRGHAGHPLNERADYYARLAADIVR